MKKVKSIMIVLLSVMVAGCSKINSEQQEDSGRLYLHWQV